MDELLTYRQCVVCAHCISNGNCPTSQKSCTVDACSVRDTCRNQRSKQATCRTQSDKCAAAALNRTEQQRVGASSGTVACLPCAEVPASDIRWSIRPRAVSAVGRLWCEVHSKVSSVQRRALRVPVNEGCCLESRRDRHILGFLTQCNVQSD